MRIPDHIKEEAQGTLQDLWWALSGAMQEDSFQAQVENLVDDIRGHG